MEQVQVIPLTKPQNPTTPGPMLIVPLGKAVSPAGRAALAAARKEKMSEPHTPTPE